MAHAEPPKWAYWLVEKICPEEYLEEVQGDLHEAFRWREQARGISYARRKFYLEALKTIRLAKFKVPDFMRPISGHLLKNYFKTTYRHLGRHKAYLFINVLGLSLALTLSIVAYINWKFDADFNQFHTEIDKIYRVTTIKSSTLEMYGISPAPISDLARSIHPAVLEAIPLDSWNVTVNKGENTYAEVLHFTEAAFFKWFDFSLVAGTADISMPNRVLLTERMAKKYFGNQDPIGQTLSFYAGDTRKREFVISGVLKNPPLNSSIQFSFITHPSNQLLSSGEKLLSNDWKRWRDAIFLVVENPEAVPGILNELNRHIPAHQLALPAFNSKGFHLEPFKEMANRSRIDREEALLESLPASAIWMNILMAILLLICACLNFANTTISLAGKRLKEIGVRKVLGGSQAQLIQQLLLESFLICLLALFVALPLADYVLGVYNQLYSFLDLKLALLDNLPLLLFLLLTVLVATLLAGAYPALYISSFNPTRVFHGAVKFGGSNWVSRILIGLQVSISLIALIAGFTFARNAHFLQTADLGFERSGVQAVVTNDAATFTVLRNELQKDPRILASAGVHSHIGDSCPRIECSINGQKEEVEYMIIGEDYLELMNFQTSKGRSFNYEMQSDYETAIMVNEKFVADFLSTQNPIGQKAIFFDTLQCHIVGVVKNFMQDGFHDPLRPLVFRLGKADQFEYLAIKTKAEDLLPVRSKVEEVWKEKFPMQPFEHYFQDDFWALSLQLTTNIKWFMMIIAIVTFLLTITGLFALMSLNVLKLNKEIAIRRVFGASFADLSLLLNKNYLLIISAGILLGCTLGTWIAFQLLNSIYNIHAGMSTPLLLVAAGSTLLVVLLTLGIKMIQVMKSKPAEILKQG